MRRTASAVACEDQIEILFSRIAVRTPLHSGTLSLQGHSCVVSQKVRFSHSEQKDVFEELI